MDRGIGKPGALLLYDSGSSKEFVSVIFKNENFGLTQKAMGGLFDVNTPAISKHLQNIYGEEARSRAAAVSKIEPVQNGGGRGVTPRPLCLRNT